MFACLYIYRFNVEKQRNDYKTQMEYNIYNYLYYNLYLYALLRGFEYEDLIRALCMGISTFN